MKVSAAAAAVPSVDGDSKSPDHDTGDDAHGRIQQRRLPRLQRFVHRVPSAAGVAGVCCTELARPAAVGRTPRLQVLTCAPSGLEDALRRSGILPQFLGRTPGTRHELAAAVGTACGKDAFGAGTTKRAFERTDAGIDGIGREIDVATLAVGTKLKHGWHPLTYLYDQTKRCARAGTLVHEPIRSCVSRPMEAGPTRDDSAAMWGRAGRMAPSVTPAFHALVGAGAHEEGIRRSPAHAGQWLRGGSHVEGHADRMRFNALDLHREHSHQCTAMLSR